MPDARWKRYVALGDSITEGLCDPADPMPALGQREPWVGWADRLAGILDRNAALSGRGIEFANLAVRGRRVRDVVDEQIPAAIELGSDLVSILIGGNDLMTPAGDPDRLAAELERGVARLRAARIDVLLATSFDPQFAFFLKPLRGKAAVYNANLWSIARRYGTHTLDLWGIREFRDRRMWSEDRVHLTSAGHRVLARHAAHSLGISYWELPEHQSLQAHDPVEPRISTSTWLRRYAVPWLGRRLRGVSAGDSLPPKLPAPCPVGGRG
jgi:lysophospholipase L1-like esterase